MHQQPDSTEMASPSAARSVARKAILGVTLVALVVLVTVAVRQNVTSEEQVVTQFNRYQEELAARTGTTVRHTLESSADELRMVASLLGAESTERPVARAAVVEAFLARAITGDRYSAGLLRPDGSTFQIRGPLGAMVEQHRADIQRWSNGAEDGEDVRLFGPSPLPEAATPVQGARPAELHAGYVLAKRVKQRGGQGASEPIRTALLAFSLADVVDRTGLGGSDASGHQFWILDAKGILLWQSEHPEMVLYSVSRYTREKDSDCGECHSSLDYVERALERQSGSATYQLIGGEKKIAAFARVRFGGAVWIVAINSTYDSVTGFHRSNRTNTVLLVLGIALVLAGGLSLAYRSDRRRLEAEQTARTWKARQVFERQLRLSQQRFRTIFESVHDAIWTVDPEGNVEFVNSQVADATGTPADRWRGRPAGELVDPADREAGTMAEQLARQGTPQSYEVHMGRQGELRLYSVKTVPLREEDQIVGTASLARDITVARRAQEKLRQASEHERVLNAVMRIGQTNAELAVKLEQALDQLLSIPWLPLAPKGAILMMNAEGDALEMQAARHMDETSATCARVGLGECLCGRAAEQGELVFAATVDARHERALHRAEPHGHYCVPLLAEKQVLGVIVLYLPHGHVRGPDEESFLRILASTLSGIIVRDRAAEALRRSEERYQLATEGATDGLWDWDLLGERVFYSARWHAMAGLQPGEVAPTPGTWFDRVHEDDVEELRRLIQAHLDGDLSHVECEYRILHTDGSWRWMLCRGMAVWNESGEPTRMAGSQTDIARRKSAEEQLLHDAFHDPLTTLANRALFMDRLERSLRRTRRRPQHMFAVLFVDLDQFKVINDGLGHQAGDTLLCNVARRLALLVRAGDTVARFGGDEFAILLDDITEPRDATLVAVRVGEEVRKPHLIGGHEVATTASIGIALSTTGYTRADDILRDADTAMYRAKASGRARHQVFDKMMHFQALSTMRLENDLRRAIDRQEFRLHYQPIVSLATGRIVEVEALVRWAHPERGMVSPLEFIRVAEETDLITPLGEWVMRTACAQCARWRAELDASLRVAVNVSAKQLDHGNIHTVVMGILEDTGLHPTGLTLELTESCIVGTSKQNIGRLQALARLGVHVALDDFGTGYSSLYTLKHLPLDTLKIDKAFIRDLARTAEDRSITGGVITMAGELGLAVTAEGVEDLEQLDILRRFNCDRVQGFLLCAPQPPELMHEFLARGGLILPATT